MTLVDALDAHVNGGNTTLDLLVEVQRRLEVEYFDQHDPAELEGEDRARFLRWNALSVGCELNEFLQEVGWKPWAVREGEVPDPDRALGELADLLHFVFNLTLAIGRTGAELAQAYLVKVRENIRRQAQEDGYDAFKSKCPQCHRDLGEAGVRWESATLEDDVVVGSAQCNVCEFQFGTYTEGPDRDRVWTSGGPPGVE